jgi:predicted Fe-S protein YdhL (DUF1289 family)
MSASPCVKICVVDPVGGLCIGCGRTVEEISLWREMAESEQVRVMATLPTRLRMSRLRAANASRERRARRA